VKIRIYGNGFTEFELPSYAQGITSLNEAPHGGQYIAEKILDIRCDSDGVHVFCELKEGDEHLTSKPEPLPVAEEIPVSAASPSSLT